MSPPLASAYLRRSACNLSLSNCLAREESARAGSGWSASTPVGYLVSNLNALGNEPLIESLELRVGGFEASFAQPRDARKRR